MMKLNYGRHDGKMKSGPGNFDLIVMSEALFMDPIVEHRVSDSEALPGALGLELPFIRFT